jgi:hypothetical protein
MKILMVLTSHEQLGDTDRKTGYWLEEFAARYCVFRDAGLVTPASAAGEQSPVDPRYEEPGTVRGGPWTPDHRSEPRSVGSCGAALISI